jgi:hypothetical protein
MSGRLVLLNGVPAGRTDSKMLLKLLQFFLGKLSRGRNGAEFPELVMGLGVRQRAHSSDGCCPVSYCGIVLQSGAKNLFSQLLQTAEVVVFHVSPGLVQFRGNLAQRVAFNKEEVQRLALILGKVLKNLLEASPSQQPITGMLEFRTVISGSGQFPSHVVEIDPRVEVTGIQVSAAGDSAVIGHLKYPEPHWAPRGIKHAALSMDQQKDVLEQVVGFGCVSQDPVGYSTNQPGIPPEQKG